MATILFQAAGAALGSVFGPVGAIIGRAAGALGGSMVDRALLGGSPTVSGPRLATARIPGADEGTAINRVYGTARVGGTLIWATRFEEEVTRERTGGKATSGPRVETFRYFANLAVGLCEGPIAGVRRVWADGRELDLTTIEMRIYRGDEEQLPDPLIEAKQGEGNAPAYRGLAYVVFERLPLDSFGNRIPLLQFEVLRPVGSLENQIRAVTIIPGASEHGYATVAVTEKTGEGSARVLNRNVVTAGTDWQASLDELQALCPNLQRVALVVSWFGTDLRAGHCRIVPGVEVAQRRDESSPWAVAGVSRAEAHLVSQNGGPAYGGTPSDASVMQAIADLKAHGLKIYLYPFVMMDIPPGNGLPDPYGGEEQAGYPWRGRITCFPVSGDGTAAVADQLAAFTDGAEGYRRMVLHYAALATAAGGVDGFIIGSELRGLTQLRDEENAFPFVKALVDLAAEVRAVMGPEPKLTYGADWSEYFGYHPQDGSGDVFFHLDPLWASPDIDAVGIDNYMPLADWRDEDLGAVNPDGFRVPDDVAAMQGQISAGEGFDWYYASEEARLSRTRSPITDGLANKPWVFRYKDLRGWWSNRHYDRAGGAEHVAPTGWLPGMKPIWFTELGCPAIDKGANQPNVFVDPKSAESAVPYFSSGGRNDSMQRRFLEAHHLWWQGEDAPAGMVDPDHVFVWTWDARPQPAFPNNVDLWADGDNWQTGHWLSGRLGSTTLGDTIAAILREHGFDDFDVSQVSGDLNGYVQGEVTSARALLEPLLEVFQVDVAEEAGRLTFRSRLKASLAPKPVSVVADIEDEPLWSESRGHDSDFAAEAVLTAYNPVLDYEQSSSRSRRAAGPSRRTLSYDLPAVLPEDLSLEAAETLLRAQRLGRRTISFAMSPAEITLEPGDAVRLDLPEAANPDGVFIVERVEEASVRRIEARHHAPLAPVNRGRPVLRRNGGGNGPEGFAPVLHFLDLPRLYSGEAASFARLAGFCRPWRRMAVSSSVTTEGYRTRTTIERPARVGVLTSALTGGVTGMFDEVNAIELDLYFGGLSSAAELAVLNGENRLAVKAENGVWEIIGFVDAEEVAPNRWRLTRLLRALAGTEDAMGAGAAVGAPVVVLDEAVVPLGLLPEERGRSLNWIVESLGPAGGRSGPHVFAGGLRAETALAPVHLRAKRLGSGDIEITWKRRSRLEGDSWDGSDIPLDEPDERYRVELLEGTAVKRTAEVAEPLFVYPASDELADFGAPQASLSLRVRQLGRAVPLGIPAETIVIVED
ncbi:glycoside hydrolase/phage tail family protein [Rhizobium sp. NTR19]|uniref:Glycoside hydrolase/phage tail family protein n=1 Tax=Neorhizobium turbinariae TaxID=2937795 RepID=A0ABT0IV69_9HYPH|nr:glycoside hydrolase/phage tail family protein [Neorhizobium turbinariae]MCK8781765.1 glycoside hydrolase/phage tail family protein [Neorhizobium turbinariae]